MLPNDARYIAIPKLWNGGRCYLVGGGPSLLNINLNRLRDQKVIAVNRAFMLVPWAAAMFFGDRRWYFDAVKMGLNSFGGLKVTVCPEHFDKPGIIVADRKRHPPGICTQRNKLSWNRSSGACAVNLAVHLGATDIVLLGYDMRRVPVKENSAGIHAENKDGERCHWWDVSSIEPGNRPYVGFRKPFEQIVADLKALGVSIVNATPGSALEWVPVIDPEEVLP